MPGRETRHPAAYQAGLRVGIQISRLPGQALGMGAVIGVHAGDIRRSAISQAVIRGHDDPGVRLAQDAQAAFAPGPSIQTQGGIIGRAILDAVDLDIGKRLAPQAFQRFVNHSPGVIAGHQNRDGRHALILPESGSD
jgi:hypothetical protein